jgi:ribosomal-protein-serine acetyltransferase
MSFALANGRSLRLLEESDADELHSLIESNRAYLAGWMPWAEKQTNEDTLAFVRGTRLQLAAHNGFQVAILDQERIVGVAGFHRVDWSERSASIGYWLAQTQQGHGTMSLAVRALVDYAFGTWELTRVEIRADVENLRSRAIPERLGFSCVGVQETAEVIGERRVDHAIYAMLARDWHLPRGSERLPVPPPG